MYTTYFKSKLNVKTFSRRMKPDSFQTSPSSLARQPYVGPGLPQKLLPAKVSCYCFFGFRDKSLFQGGVVSPTPILPNLTNTKPTARLQSPAKCRLTQTPTISATIASLHFLLPVSPTSDVNFKFLASHERRTPAARRC
jgi:hypothetical protein